MRIEKVENKGEFIEIIWADEAEIDFNAGVVRSYRDQIDIDKIPQALVEHFIDAVAQIIDESRLLRHKVPDQFIADR